MKKLIFIFAVLTGMMLFNACNKDGLTKIEDVRMKVSFYNAKQATVNKSTSDLTMETPQVYNVALKKVTLLGDNETEDVVLFEADDLASSLVFDFADPSVTHSLLQGTDIPEGEYSSLKLEMYYQEMLISIMTIDRGLEYRMFRIYLSDDAEVEGGLHQPGDMCQVNDGVEIGWLLGEGQYPNMDPVSPREAAYTDFGDGVSWYDFAGKSGQDYGPFGDVEFMNSAPHPIYYTTISFDYVDDNGDELILDFNVNDCWQFEDKNGDGHFGAEDLDAEDPTEWHMALPTMTVTLD